MTVLGFTRPVQRIKDSVREAEELGFTVMAAPSLEILPGDDSEFDRFESSVTEGCVVVFGSATALEQCMRRFGDRFPGIVSGARIVSIGPATTKKLAEAGVEAHDVPEDYSSYGLVDLLKDDVSGRRVVVVRSDSGSDVLSDGLREAGADLVDVASYRLKEVGMCPALLHMFIAIKRGRMDVMAFTSPMSASSFVGRMEDHFGKEEALSYLRGIKIAAIGRPTKERLESLGLPPDIVPGETTFRDMLLAVKAAFERSDQLRAHGDLPAGHGEPVDLGVPARQRRDGGLPAHHREVVDHHEVDTPPGSGLPLEVGGQVLGEVYAVVAQDLPVQVDYLAVRLLPFDLRLNQVHEELEAVGPEAGDGLEAGVCDEI